jgi:hypothetical protein
VATPLTADSNVIILAVYYTCLVTRNLVIMTSTPGWVLQNRDSLTIEDRQMIDSGEDIAPEGKKWECCTTCQGKGKVLVDDILLRSDSAGIVIDGLTHASLIVDKLISVRQKRSEDQGIIHLDHEEL